MGGAHCVWHSAAAVCCCLLVASGIARIWLICFSACGCAKLNCFITNLPYWSDTLLLFCPFCPIVFPLTQSLIRSLNHRTGQWVVMEGQWDTLEISLAYYSFDGMLWLALMTYSMFVALQGDYGLSRLYQQRLVWAAVRSTREDEPDQRWHPSHNVSTYNVHTHSTSAVKNLLPHLMLSRTTHS